jgi:hypothetical protein
MPATFSAACPSHPARLLLTGGLLPAQWHAVIASMHDYGLTATEPEDAQLLE